MSSLTLTTTATTHSRPPLPPLPIFATHLATIAAHLAVSCQILPLLPPITPNVKSHWRANRLEFRVREERDADHKMKSGKNGNVDHSSQHCHTR